MADLTLYPAQLWRRVAAMLYDSVLILAIFFLAGFINLLIQMSIYGDQLLTMTEHGYDLGGPVFYLTLLIVSYGFYGFFFTRTGQTLGMLAWRIKVVSNDNNLITTRQSLIRFLMAILSLSLAGTGLLWALIDPKKRSWQDIASSSKVILLEKPNKKR